MSKKIDGLQQWVQEYEVPEAPENRMEELISMGKSYMEGPEFNKNSLRNVFLSQLQYLPVSFWIVQIGFLMAVVAAVCLLGHFKVQLYYPLTVLAITIPFIVLLGVKQISKSNTYDMWEIEQSSRCQLVKLVACRMVIVGLFDLFFITGVLALMSYYYQKPIIGMILYGIVPLNISCASYLVTVTKGEKSEASYHLIACMVCLMITFSFILRQQVLFETSMIWMWAVFYVSSIIFLGKAIQKYLKYEKMIGELTWSLQ